MRDLPLACPLLVVDADLSPDLQHESQYPSKTAGAFFVEPGKCSIGMTYLVKGALK